MDKRESYSSRDLVAGYDGRRFGGRSGAWVNSRELETVYSLIPEDGLLLDFPCGTGRLSRFLKEKKLTIIGADYSPAMLQSAKKERTIPLVRADMSSIPFIEAAFNCVVSMRFVFHYKMIEPIFQGVKRILKKDGIYIFDTFNWSPRAGGLWGDRRVFIHPKREIRMLLAKVGMEIVEERSCFFFSPVLYRSLPLTLVKFLERLEESAPAWLLVRVFWKVRKTGR